MIEPNSCFKRKCIHLEGIRNDGDETTERHFCAAYPSGIPEDISSGENKHEEIQDEQVGEYVYTPGLF